MKNLKISVIFLFVVWRNLIDYQEYPVKAAERATKARRSLGIGFIGLAHYLAKLGFKYDSQEAWDAVHGLTEAFQYLSS